MTTRRAALRLLAGLPALSALPVQAAGYPDRPIRIILPFAPGGNSDLVARLVAPPMAARLGQAVVVDNRAGAGGSIGATAVARAKPDGYNVLFGSSGPLSVNPAVQRSLPYDAEKDFAPVGLVSRTPLTLTVHHGLPTRTVQELIAYARDNPGRVTIASAGVGSSTHLALELFKAATGAELTHVPYRSGGDLIPDLVAGNVAGTFTEISTAMPLQRDGTARVLAIGSAQRFPAASAVPTFIESGMPGYTAASYAGLVVPTGTPSEVVEALRSALASALADAAVRSRMEEIGVLPAQGEEVTPAGFAALLREELASARKAVKIAGLVI